MTKVILNIPKEKMSSFIHLIMQLGLKDHAIHSQLTNFSAKTQKFTFSKILLFDWEFFSNELEYE